MDWGSIFGVGGFAGVVVLVLGQVIKAVADKRKIAAEAGVTDAARETSLSEAAVSAMERLTANYESRINAVQADASASVASARADAANSVAAALHEVSTARNEASAARRSAEAVEQVLMRVRSIAWAIGPDDERITRVRQLVGDGFSAFGSSLNGSH